MARFRTLLATGALGAAIVLLAACTSAPAPAPRPSPTATSSGRVLQFRLPYLRADPDDPNALNIARHGAPGAPLLLFLPATGAVPSDYTEFLDTASGLGFSVLGLDYFNRGRSLTRTCGPDVDCYGKFQRNRFDGSQPSRFSRVGEANAILTRLRAALAYLDKHDSSGDWQRFSDENGRGIRWSRFVVAGHSQGGGEAAFISHYRSVRGVLMFASPVETYQDATAGWIERPGRTPPDRMWGLDSSGDMYYSRITPTWAELGMGTVDLDDAVPVPTGSRVLVSSLDLGTPREAHGRIVGDATPRDADGTPRLAPTWRWMLERVR